MKIITSSSFELSEMEKSSNISPNWIILNKSDNQIFILTS